MLVHNSDSAVFSRVLKAADIVRSYLRCITASSWNLAAIRGVSKFVHPAQGPSFQRLNSRRGRTVAASLTQKGEQERTQANMPAYSSFGGVSSSYSSPTMGSADSDPEAFEGGRRFLDKAQRPASQVLQLRETIPLPEGGQAAAQEAFQGGVEERRNGSFGTGAVAP
ncbi:hypothetical protein V5799_033599 [Amblyomma americanum]|uniref:Uncharacterized protein n=1 Tax=Amblyomma americanum TaxID=6943 RepID=A0AAQ4DMU7_AMBAM